MHGSDEIARRLDDDALASLVKQAQLYHPNIAVPLELFMPILTRCLLPSGVESAPPEKLQVADLYLAFAYGLGIQAAQTQVEAEHFVRIKRRLERMSISASIAAEILQDLRCRLVEMSNPAYSGQAYSGRGSLGGWLFISAIRIAERRTERARREIPDHGSVLDVRERLFAAVDPELEHLMHSCKAAFESAMQGGLAALSSRERNLLRYHFLEHLSIDRLAEIYQVHRATVARWLLRAQHHLADETRTRFAAQIPIGEGSLPRLLAFVKSKLNLSLSALLQRAAEPEA